MYFYVLLYNFIYVVIICSYVVIVLSICPIAMEVRKFVYLNLSLAKIISFTHTHTHTHTYIHNTHSQCTHHIDNTVPATAYIYFIYCAWVATTFKEDIVIEVFYADKLNI